MGQSKSVQTVKLFNIIIHPHLVDYERLLATNGPLSGTWLILEDKLITSHENFHKSNEWMHFSFRGCLDHKMVFVHCFWWFSMCKMLFKHTFCDPDKSFHGQNAFHDTLNHKMDCAKNILCINMYSKTEHFWTKCILWDAVAKMTFIRMCLEREELCGFLLSNQFYSFAKK